MLVPIPLDRSQSSPSGRFVLRLDPGLHSALRRAAGARGVSLNEYCATRLAAPSGELIAFGGAPETVRRVAAMLGDSLVGVVAFGSWARGELTDTSDIDVLIVVGEDVAITRDLYRRWDEDPVAWNGRRVDPHFVHLPAVPRTASGLWAEVATDGVVLFASDLRLSSTLSAVRRSLAEGRLRRRFVHGQGYWTEVA